MRRAVAFTAVVAAAFAHSTIAASADEVSDFFKGRTITFYVGAGSGGTYGLYSRVLSQHLGRHIPGNPEIILNFKGGSSGGIVASNYMHNAAPKDGSAIGMTQQTAAVAQVLRPEPSKYDCREWSWIGAVTPIRNMLAIWHKAAAQSIEEARKIEVTIGATGKSSPTYITPMLLNRFVGTKFKIIRGYKGVKGLNLAMEQGETFGRGASYLSLKTSTPQWLAEKKIKVLVFDSLSRSPDLPDVPRLVDLVDDPREKKIAELVGISAEFGRAVFLPPGVPKARVEAFRAAFDATMKDKAFLADAKKRQMPVEPLTPAQLDGLVQKIHATPEDVIAEAREIMGTSS